LLIDAHMHVNLNGISPRNLFDYLDRDGIDWCWLLTWEESQPTNPLYRPLTIESVFESYHINPSRVVPMYAPDPARQSSEADLEYWVTQGVKGIGELKVTSSWYSPEITKLLNQARRLGLLVLFHMEEETFMYRPMSRSRVESLACKVLNRTEAYRLGRNVLEFATQKSPVVASMLTSRQKCSLGYLPEFSGLEARLQEYPDVEFVAHGPLFWKGIASDMGFGPYPTGAVSEEGISPRLLRCYPNLSADLSGLSGYNALSRDKKFSQRFLSEFSSKILFGTDNTSLGLKNLLGKLRLSLADIRKIRGENAFLLIEKSGNAASAKMA